MSQEFSEIFLSHKGKLTDKWSSYLPIYDRVLAKFKDSSINLLEIGIQNGGSLEIWSEYFPFAKNIIGCDVDENCRNLKFANDRVSVVVGDANARESITAIMSVASEFDIIIDDGSHRSKDVIASFIEYFPKLKNDGVYIVEDMHTSYWNHYGGSLNKGLSSIDFFKSLVDILNFDHWESEKSRTEYVERFFDSQKKADFESVLSQIHQISFFNSICIIEKKSVENNYLGLRRILGDELPVTVNSKGFADQSMDLRERGAKITFYARLRGLIKRSIMRE